MQEQSNVAKLSDLCKKYAQKTAHNPQESAWWLRRGAVFDGSVDKEQASGNRGEAAMENDSQDSTVDGSS